ncbi:MAG: phosphoribosylamine--glycine ligase [Candidatus Bathyarchaeota archaeon]|nr:MAG: phosphoribosylamine--glycine ligase [Candidatus Bathyarchaeota archaeon]
MMNLKVLVVGHGAREHAIAKKIVESDAELHAAMGSRNPGIAGLSKRSEIMDITDTDRYAKFGDVDVAFIGPEAALAAGVTDRLNELGVPVVGPTREASKLEWSKAYTRLFLSDHGIEGNPEYSICRTGGEIREFLDAHAEVAVKPDVLTGGKGVRITGEHLKSREEVEAYAMERIGSDGLVVLEPRLVGREFTLQAFTDGKSVSVMPLVRDYKRAFDGDRGPNTGSMGSYSREDHGLPGLSEASVRRGVSIMEHTVRELTATGEAFRGVLYGGFMETEEGVYLLEYNSRFGDPEAMNVLALLKRPLLDVGWEIIDGRLSDLGFEMKATVCVYIVPDGYPVDPKRGSEVRIKQPKSSELFFASVHEEDGAILTTGSRSVALLAKGESISEAREKVYGDVPGIEGALFHRRDIGEGV